jgi:hypothetical protein
VTDFVAENAADSIIARERLRILMIGFYVRGGMMLFFGCFFLIYVAMFAGFSFIPQSEWNKSTSVAASPTPGSWSTPPHHSNQGAPPPIFFRIVAGVFAGVTLLIWTIGALTAYAGRCIQKRRLKPLIYVMAALNCLFVPYGTLLGVFTFIVLGSPAAAGEFSPTPT